VRAGTLGGVSDEFIDPDEILDPDDPRLGGVADDGGDNLDQLARRAVDAVVGLARRANALAGGVLLFVLVAVLVGYALGIAAFNAGWQTAWIVIGGFFAIVAIGSVITSMWRMRSVRKSADQLVGEVRGLISGNRDNERVVITTVESSEESSEVSAIQLSRNFFDMRTIVSGSTNSAQAVTSAVTAVTSFPLLMGLATLIGAVFLLLSPFFLIALAF